MKKIFFAIIILFSQLDYSQDYQSEFLQYFKSKDTLNQLKVLKKWKKSNPNDSELFTSYFNYYFSKSKNEILEITKNQTNKESLVLKDTLNKTAGYIGSKIYYCRMISIFEIWYCCP